MTNHSQKSSFQPEPFLQSCLQPELSIEKPFYFKRRGWNGSDESSFIWEKWHRKEELDDWLEEEGGFPIRKRRNYLKEHRLKVWNRDNLDCFKHFLRMLIHNKYYIEIFHLIFLFYI